MSKAALAGDQLITERPKPILCAEGQSITTQPSTSILKSFDFAPATSY